MNDHLTLSGWIFLVSAWTFITALTVFCFVKISKEKKEEIVDPLTNPDEDKRL